MEKKRKRIEAELELPEEIIQHIQSFLDGKEAAQTTLLSRSWFQAWLTRPNLDFDQEHFANKSDNGFWKLVKTTVERYEKLNIKINSLRLWIDKEHSLVNELIIKVLKLGATCLDFKIHFVDSDFAFPNEVFGFETLTRLSVSGCKIDAVEKEDNERLKKRSGLKCLTLELVILEGNTVIWDIVSSYCPLIEFFSLTFIHGYGCGWPHYFVKENLSNEFHKLKSLYLYKARFQPSFLDSLCSKCPCLVDLTLHDCRGGSDDLQISSPSLECITIYIPCYIRSVKFDVPRIRKFSLFVSNIPQLSFEETNTSNWRSNIHIYCKSAHCASWFRELTRLLKKLRSLDSEIVLSLCMSKEPSGRVGKLQDLRKKPEVFHIKISGPYATFPDFYSSLFKICRPSCIEPCTIPMFIKNQGADEFVWKRNRKIQQARLGRCVDEFVWKRKIQQACLDSCIEHQMRGDCDLKKVKVDYYDESISKRCTRLVDTTATTSIRNAADDEQIFFNFKWGPKSGLL